MMSAVCVQRIPSSFDRLQLQINIVDGIEEAAHIEQQLLVLCPLVT